jgi:uncharacterized membrane protein
VAVQEVVSMHHMEMYSGPTPSAREMRELAKVYPEAPKIIFDNFTKQSDHRIKIEDYAITENTKRSREGLRLGFIVTILCLILGFVAIMSGHDQAGVAIIAIDIVALAGVFVYGSQQQRSEREAKSKRMDDALPSRLPKLPGGGNKQEGNEDGS